MEENLTASLLHSHVISISQLPVPFLTTRYRIVSVNFWYMLWADPGRWWQVPTKAVLPLPFSAVQGRENIKRLLEQDKGRERLPCINHHMENRLRLGKSD